MIHNDLFVITDQRQPKSDTDVASIRAGAVVAYPTDEGVRRGIVLHQTPQSTQILDGENVVRVRGERRNGIKKLADSAEAYARRTVAETAVLRMRNGWCSVPSNMVREVNTTPIVLDPLLVVVRATQVYHLQPTSIGVRRKLNVDEALKTSFTPNDVGYWDDRTFRQVDELEAAPRSYQLDLVDELPPQL